MQEHTSVEESQALGSTPFMPMVSFLCAPFLRHLSIIFVTTTIVHCCFFFNFWLTFVSCINAILKYTLYYYIIFTKNLIISIMSNGNRTEWSITQGVNGRVIWNYEHAGPWIRRHELLLPIICVKKKKGKKFFKSSVEKWLSKSKESNSE